MPPIAHPGRLLGRELAARGSSANRHALDLGVPSGRSTDILNGRRGVTAEVALRLGRIPATTRSSGWVHSQYDIAVVEGERGEEIAPPVKPADAAWMVEPADISTHHCACSVIASANGAKRSRKCCLVWIATTAARSRDEARMEHEPVIAGTSGLLRSDDCQAPWLPD